MKRLFGSVVLIFFMVALSGCCSDMGGCEPTSSCSACSTNSGSWY